MRIKNLIFLTLLSLILITTASFALNDTFKVQSEFPTYSDDEYIEGEIIVWFEDYVSQNEMESTIANISKDISIKDRSSVTPTRVLIEVPEGEENYFVNKFSNSINVRVASLNHILHAFWSPNDPYYSYQWHFNKPNFIYLEEGWDIEQGGDSSVVVAVIDTGVAYEDYPVPSYEQSEVIGSSYHQAPDLAGTTFTAGYDFVHNDSHPNDQNGHGTHVSGTVAQTTNNSYGVAGMAFNTTIMPIQVLNNYGSGSAYDIADGIDFARTNGADVINMSLGGSSPIPTVEAACEDAYNAGVVIVAASGNNASGSISYPAAYDEVIAVGAVDYNGDLSYYSNWGNGQELVAPGGDTTADENGDGNPDGVLQETYDQVNNGYNLADVTSFAFHFFQGTSMASPHTAGLTALLLAQGVSGSGSTLVENVRTILHESATDLGPAGYDTTYGYGLINCYETLNDSGDQLPTAFDLSSPSDGTRLLSGDQNSFDWTNSTDPEGNTITYRIYYKIDSDSDWSYESSGSSSEHTFSGGFFNQGETYDWRVLAMDNGDPSHGTWSNQTWQFTINSPPQSFSLLSPADGSTVEPNATFDWEDAGDNEGDAVTYSLQYTTDSSFNNYEEITGITESTYTFNPGTLSEETTYYWRVVADDSYETTMSNETWSFFVNTPPSAFNLLQPEDGEYVSSTPTMDWEDSVEGNLMISTSEESSSMLKSVSEIDSLSKIEESTLTTDVNTSGRGTITYDLWYSENTEFDPHSEINDLTESTYTFYPGELADGHTYYWKVRATDEYSETWSGPDDYWSFTVETSDIVNLISFSAEEKGSSAMVLKWEAEATENQEIKGFNLYRRELNLSEEVSGNVDISSNSPRDAHLEDNWSQVNTSLITGENPYSYVDSGVESGTTYEYKLEAIVEDTKESIGTTIGNCGLPTSFEMVSIHPNPSSDLVNITISTPYSTDVKIEIYDLTGRLVKSHQIGEVSEGNHTEVININGLSSGIYTAKATAYDNDTDDVATSIKKLVIVK